MHTPKAGANHWLLIKERDAHVDRGGTSTYPDESIYSGLAVDDLLRAGDIQEELRERALTKGGRSFRIRAEDIEPMKATRRDSAFSDPAWVFELKYDGYRLITGLEKGEAKLISRNGHDLTSTFPEVARAIRAFPTTVSSWTARWSCTTIVAYPILVGSRNGVGCKIVAMSCAPHLSSPPPSTRSTC